MQMLHNLLQGYDLFSCDKVGKAFFTLLVEFTYRRDICESGHCLFLVHLRDLLLFYSRSASVLLGNLVLFLGNVMSEGRKGVDCLFQESVGEYLLRALHSSDQVLSEHSLSTLCIYLANCPPTRWHL